MGHSNSKIIANNTKFKKKTFFSFTVPSKKLVERLADVLPEYRRIFPQNECEVPAKRRKIVDDAMILEHVQAQTVIYFLI